MQVEISEVITHPLYGKEWPVDFDLALLKTKQNIDFAKFPNIRPICLPENNDNDYNQQKAVVTGWGKMEFNGEEYSDVLRKAELRVITNTECSTEPHKYQAASNGSCANPQYYCITQQVLCAQGIGKDACTGDSGNTND